MNKPTVPTSSSHNKQLKKIRNKATEMTNIFLCCKQRYDTFTDQFNRF